MDRIEDKALGSRFRLLAGDCLEQMKTLPDASIDMVLCDPPYGTTACKWDTVISMPELWSQIWRVLKENGPAVLFGAQPYTSALGASAIRQLRYSWVWVKSRPTGHLNAKTQPLTGFEDLLVFYRKKPTYNPQGVTTVSRAMKNSASDLRRHRGNVTSTVSGGLRADYIQTATGYPRGVLHFSSEDKRVHPTQKPVALLEYLIRTYTNEGETVLDPTMGSGSTGVACLNTGRKFIGIEREPEYLKIAETRCLSSCRNESAASQSKLDLA